MRTQTITAAAKALGINFCRAYKQVNCVKLYCCNPTEAQLKKLRKALPGTTIETSTPDYSRFARHSVWVRYTPEVLK